MSIRLRLMALIASFGLVSLIITGLALMSLSEYRGHMRRYGQAYEEAYRIERINHTVTKAVMESRGIYASQTATEARSFAGHLNGDLDQLEADLSQWRTSSDPLTRHRYQAVAPAAAQFIAMRRELSRIGGEGRTAEAKAMGTNAREGRMRFQSQLDALVAEAREDLTVAENEAMRFADARARTFLTVALLSIILILSGAIWLIVHFITRPLRQVAHTIIGLSEGRLDTPVPDATGKDEVADVWRAVARLKANAVEAEKIITAQREIERQQTLEARQLLLD